MTNLHIVVRTTVSAALIATGALSAAAHAETRGDIAKLDPKTNTYCVTEMVTGSNIPRRVCATRQEWIDSGATIVATARTQIATK